MIVKCMLISQHINIVLKALLKSDIASESYDYTFKCYIW